MADTFKMLGQLAPLPATLTDLYTVPAGRSAIVSVTICNTSAVGTSYRLSVAVAGAVDNTKQYLAFDTAIAGNTSYVWNIGLALAATDVIRVFATLGTLSFTASGMEIS